MSGGFFAKITWAQGVAAEISAGPQRVKVIGIILLHSEMD
jgi:hypothetical protein